MLAPRLLPLWIAAVWLLAAVRSQAHPVAQGSVEIRILPDAVTLNFRVSNEQIFVAESIGPNAKPVSSLEEMWERHGEYVKQHVTVRANDNTVTATSVAMTPPADRTVAGFTGYALRYATGPIARLEIRQDLLREIEYAPGNPWEATFAARVFRGDTVIRDAAVLTAKQPLTIELGSVSSSFDSSAAMRLAPLGWDYLVYGLWHIAGGWDHILFVVALVLAVPRVWPVVALVTAFTVAHTITLTLAVLRVVSAPGSIVEPVIAGSIVIAAALNFYRTDNPPLWPRLAVAFGFGLFHGLGFASGLIAAMEGFKPSALAAAIAGFSIGVETGHQLVVVPVVCFLWVLKRYASGALPFVTRLGTAIVLVAGLWLLTFTLRRSAQPIGSQTRAPSAVALLAATERRCLQRTLPLELTAQA